MSASNPKPRAVRDRIQSVVMASPRPRCVRQMPAPRSHRVRAADDSSPDIFRVCPHLIQMMSAKRCRNLRRVTNRSSRTCCRPKMSSSSCGKDRLHTAPSLNCSRNTACQRARRPLPIFVTKCWENPCGLTAALRGNGLLPSKHKANPSLSSLCQPPLRPAKRPTRRLPQIVHAVRA